MVEVEMLCLETLSLMMVSIIHSGSVDFSVEPEQISSLMIRIFLNQIKPGRPAKFSRIDPAEGQRCYKTFSSTAETEGIRLDQNFIPAQIHISGPSYRRSIQLLSPCFIKIFNSWPTCRTDLCFMRLFILSNRFY